MRYNILRNADIQNLDYWEGNSRFYLDGAIFRSPPYSIRMEESLRPSPQDDRAVWNLWYPVSQLVGEEVSWGAFLKCAPGSRASVGVDFSSAVVEDGFLKHRFIMGYSTMEVDSPEWREVGATVRVPEEAQYANLWCMATPLDGREPVWIDNAYLLSPKRTIDLRDHILETNIPTSNVGAMEMSPYANNHYVVLRGPLSILVRTISHAGPPYQFYIVDEGKIKLVEGEAIRFTNREPQKGIPTSSFTGRDIYIQLVDTLALEEKPWLLGAAFALAPILFVSGVVTGTELLNKSETY